MKMNTVKLITLAAVVSMPLVGGTAYAQHELENQPAMPEQNNDGHISWHEFRHELGVYPTANANMDHHGVITLSGHVDSGIEKNSLERIAMKVRGATDIKNLINID